MRNRLPFLLFVAGFGFAAAVGFGCEEPTIEPEDAEAYAQQWSDSVDQHLEQRVVQAAASEALELQFERGDPRPERFDGEQHAYGQMVQQLYERREFEPALVDGDQLSSRGEAVYEALQQVEDHHLDADPYRLDEIEEALESFERRLEGVDEFDGLEATASDRQEAVDWLVEQPETEFELTADNHEQLTEILLEDRSRGQRLEEAVQELEDQQGSVAEAAALVEQYLAAGLARYAGELGHTHIQDIFVHPRHWDYYNQPEVENSGPRPDPDKGAFRGRQVWREAANIAGEVAEDNREEILADQVLETVEEVLEAEEPGERVAEIPPQHPQYQGLVEEYRRYRDIVDDGGWEEVSRVDHLAEGHSSETIRQLKERLQIEGYYPEDAELDETFDEQLTDAIREYQQTHQMQVDGRPDAVFWRSLNISAQRRLEQIGLNLERWRQSNIDHHSPEYAFVNIPDFTVELWEDQQRVHRSATIVGDNEQIINPMTGDVERANRTPVPMAAYIDRVYYNPYWNLPERLRAADVTPDVRESVVASYAVRFDELYEEARATGREDDDAGEEIASLSGELGGEEGEDADASEDDESADAGEDTEEDAGEEPEVSAEESGDDESVDERDAEDALAEWTTIDDVRNTETDRIEQQRVFRRSQLRRLESEVAGDNGEDLEEFRARFPYLDWDTGVVDVVPTDPDHIPAWYEANGYEVMHPGREWEYVRMLPSPGNALGSVQVIFPNYDNIYLHDTPERHLFRSEVRGFSSGCIRMEQPVEFAQHVLELGGVADEVNPDRLLAAGEFYPVFLERQFPIFIEYYTVRVDDEGRANFLADVYDYDEEELGESS